VTLIYAHPGIKVICPDNAENTNGSCQCKTGYRVEIETNRTCGKIRQKFYSNKSREFEMFSTKSGTIRQIHRKYPLESDN
jgi:hypothetical protein